MNIHPEGLDEYDIYEYGLLHNEPLTTSSSVPWTLLPSEPRVATPRVPNSKESKVSRWRLAKQNVDWPKLLNSDIPQCSHVVLLQI